MPRWRLLHSFSQKYGTPNFMFFQGIICHILCVLALRVNSQKKLFIGTLATFRFRGQLSVAHLHVKKTLKGQKVRRFAASPPSSVGVRGRRSVPSVHPSVQRSSLFSFSVVLRCVAAKAAFSLGRGRCRHTEGEGEREGEREAPRPLINETSSA